ncbi:MAG: 3-oxoacyl-[acyl-carrier protein] reductase, partial [uncultured Chloroflexia bacterium]
MDVKDKVVIITGASAGIGAATARALARRGATVVLAARRAPELTTLVAEIEAQGGRALAVPTDVSQRADIDHLVKQTLDAYGRIDVLVNNAGITGGSQLFDSDDQEMERIINVNMLAPARCIQAVLPAMQQQRSGVIVNMGSVSGEVAIRGLYSATKFGLRGMSDALRRELRGSGIEVVLIAPGFIRTSMTEGLKLPMPGPEAVARAVIDGIRRPRRRIIVPAIYAPLAFVAKVLPWLVDRIFGSRRYQQLSRD